VRQHERAVVVGAEAADGGIEDLQRLRTRPDLTDEDAGGGARELRREDVPRARIAVHEELHVLVVARAAPFDEVGRERERRPGEADERHVRP
jgi:hypothetical protein